jgi:hypothetical protein
MTATAQDLTGGKTPLPPLCQIILGRIVREEMRQDLDRDIAAQFRVLSPMDFAIPPTPGGEMIS